MVRIADTLTNASVSVGGTSNSNHHRTSNGKLETKRAMPKRSRQACYDANHRQKQALLHYQTHESSTIRAQGHRNAEFVRALGHCIRNDAVNSYGSKNQCQGSEGTEQPHDGLPLKYRARYDLFHGTDLRDRGIFVQSCNFVTDGRNDRRQTKILDKAVHLTLLV